jgi:nucleotide-binding universal stress UspA family protein
MKMLLCSIGSQRRMMTLCFGAQIAGALPADVTLLGIAHDRQRIADLGRTLTQVAHDMAVAGLQVQVRVEAGNAEDIVMAEMKETAYDLVAIGALGGRRSRRNFFDTVAMRIIEQAQSSVLVIKGERQDLARVLICSSGTEYGHLPVWIGASIACGAGARATVLHVMDAMPTMYAGLGQMEETLTEILETDTELAHQLKWAAQAVNAECEKAELKLRHGLVADEILQESQDGDFDLIVLGSSRSAGGLVRVLMGDVTRDSVHRAQVPVLVVCPKE